MKLEQSFEVAAPLRQVWEALIDVERVAPCLPGAAVIARNDDGSYDGEFKVKIGPTSAAYTGRLHMDRVDEDARTATMQAAGTDRRGQGGAKATIVSRVQPGDDGQTKVDVSSEYHITGRLARFGRGGMIEEISAQLLVEFAANLQAMIEADGGEAAPGPVAASAAEAESGPGSDPVPAPAPPVIPAGDPDGAIEGALPVADSLADEPVTPGPAPAAAPSAGAVPAEDAFAGEPAAPAGSAVARRVRENPAPLAALLLGFLVALRVLRRRA